MPQQERRTVNARRVGKLGLAALLVAAIGILDPAHASAACSGNIITNVLVSMGRADFGADPHLLGTPTNSGRICWSTEGVLGAILEGQLYYDHLVRAGCAHIVVRFRRSGGQIVSQHVNSVCSPGGLRQKSVFLQVKGAVRRITLNVSTSETPTGPRTPVGARAFSI